MTEPTGLFFLRLHFTAPIGGRSHMNFIPVLHTQQDRAEELASTMTALRPHLSHVEVIHRDGDGNRETVALIKQGDIYERKTA